MENIVENLSTLEPVINNCHESNDNIVSLLENLLPQARFKLILKQLNNEYNALNSIKFWHLIQRIISLIDTLLTEQIDIILHTPKFQRLESSWRGISYLCEQTSGLNQVKLREFE